MARRKPALKKLQQTIGFVSRISLEDTISD